MTWSLCDIPEPSVISIEALLKRKHDHESQHSTMLTKGLAYGKYTMHNLNILSCSSRSLLAFSEHLSSFIGNTLLALLRLTTTNCRLRRYVDVLECLMGFTDCGKRWYMDRSQKFVLSDMFFDSIAELESMNPSTVRQICSWMTQKIQGYSINVSGSLENS